RSNGHLLRRPARPEPLRLLHRRRQAVRVVVLLLRAAPVAAARLPRPPVAAARPLLRREHPRRLVRPLHQHPLAPPPVRRRRRGGPGMDLPAMKRGFLVLDIETVPDRTLYAPEQKAGEER